MFFFKTGGSKVVSWEFFCLFVFHLIWLEFNPARFGLFSLFFLDEECNMDPPKMRDNKKTLKTELKQNVKVK